MKNKILHILTYDFPYIGTDSQFFVDETNFLSREFKEIKLYPIKKGTTKIKGLNKNINADLSLIKEIHNPFNLLTRFIKIIFCRYMWSELKLISKNNLLRKIRMIFTERYLAEIIYLTFKKKKIKNDYFYSYWANHSLIGFYLLKKKGLIKKCFSRIMGSDLKGFIPNDSYFAFRKIRFTKLDLVLTINEEQNKILKTQKLINKNKIHKNYLGINHQRLVLDHKKNIINFACCSRLIPLKNNIEIFKFVNFFSMQNPDIKIFFYCIGQGEEKEKLIHYAKKKFSNNINYFIIDRTKSLVTFLKKKKINFFFNFSKSEGMSFAVMEALSCSVPIICTNIPGNTEIINKKNGYVLDKFNKKNLLSLSNKITKDYLNKKVYYKKRRKSLDVVNSHISRNKNQKKLNKILNNLLS